MRVIAKESKRTSIKYAVSFPSSRIKTHVYLTENPGYLRCQLIIPASVCQGSLPEKSVLQNLHDHCRTIREYLQTTLKHTTKSIFGENYIETVSVEAVSSCPCQSDDCFIAPISPDGFAECLDCCECKELSPQERVWFSRLNHTEAEVSALEYTLSISPVDGVSLSFRFPVWSKMECSF
jgi:hypothetical protein